MINIFLLVTFCAPYCTSRGSNEDLSHTKSKLLIPHSYKTQFTLQDSASVLHLCISHLKPCPPPAPGNTGDFDFWSSKSLLKAPPWRDYSLVKPLLFSPRSLLAFHFTTLFVYIKQTPGISAKLVKAPLTSTAIPCPPPGCGAVFIND